MIFRMSIAENSLTNHWEDYASTWCFFLKTNRGWCLDGWVIQLGIHQWGAIMCFPTIWSLQWCDCWIVLSCFIDSCNIDYMILYKLYIGYCFIFNTIWPYGLPDIAQEDAAVKRLVADLERARRSWIFKLGMMDLVTLWYVHLRYLRQMVIWKLIWINVFLRIYYIYKYIIGYFCTYGYGKSVHVHVKYPPTRRDMGMGWKSKTATDWFWRMLVEC
jgi:hypothetical protein